MAAIIINACAYLAKVKEVTRGVPIRFRITTSENGIDEHPPYQHRGQKPTVCLGDFH